MAKRKSQPDPKRAHLAAMQKQYPLTDATLEMVQHETREKLGLPHPLITTAAGAAQMQARLAQLRADKAGILDQMEANPGNHTRKQFEARLDSLTATLDDLNRQIQTAETLLAQYQG